MYGPLHPLPPRRSFTNSLYPTNTNLQLMLGPQRLNLPCGSRVQLFGPSVRRATTLTLHHLTHAAAAPSS